MITHPCPNCATMLDLEAEALGQMQACPACEQPFKAPAPPRPPRPPIKRRTVLVGLAAIALLLAVAGGIRWQQARVRTARAAVTAQLGANAHRQDWVQTERAGYAKMIQDAEEFLVTTRPGPFMDSIRQMTYDDVQRWRLLLATLNREAARLKLEFSDLESVETSSSVPAMEASVRQSRRELARTATEWNASFFRPAQSRLSERASK